MSTVVLVTGASGFLGCALSQRLCEDGRRVRAMCRTPTPELLALAVRFPTLKIVKADLGDTNALRAACADVVAVFHVAAKAGVWGTRDEYERSNVVGTQNVLDAMRATGVQRLVYTSTPSVVHAGTSLEAIDESAPYATRFSAFYPETKARAERMVLAANSASLRTVALRPHLIWGPGDHHLLPRLIERARAGRLVLVDGGKHVVDATYIDNAVDAHILALAAIERGDACGKAYFVAQGEPLTIADLVRKMLQACDQKFAPRSVPRALAVAIGTAVESTCRLIGISKEPPITRFMAEQLGSSHHYDLSAARRDLGYRATVSTEVGMQRLREYWHERA